MCPPTKISQLIDAVRQLVEVQTNAFEWIKSHHELATKADLKEMEKRIMKSVAELMADVRTANASLRKLIADTAAQQTAVFLLKAKIAELEAVIAAGGAITQELVDLVAETKSLAQTVDDNVPELPEPAPQS
jgi:hypothetical protein